MFENHVRMLVAHYVAGKCSSKEDMGKERLQ